MAETLMLYQDTMATCGIPVQTLCCSGLWWRCRAWKLWSRWRFGVVLVEAFSYKWWCKMKLQKMREAADYESAMVLRHLWLCRTTFFKRQNVLLMHMRGSTSTNMEVTVDFCNLSNWNRNSRIFPWWIRSKCIWYLLPKFKETSAALLLSITEREKSKQKKKQPKKQ